MPTEEFIARTTAIGEATLDTVVIAQGCVKAGLLPATSPSLIVSQPGGEAVVSTGAYTATFVRPAATSLTLTANSDNYVDLTATGTYTVTAVAVGATAPTQAANTLRLYRMTTTASAASNAPVQLAPTQPLNVAQVQNAATVAGTIPASSAGAPNGVATLNAATQVIQPGSVNPATAGRAGGVATLTGGGLVAQDPASKGQPNGVAALDANQLVGPGVRAFTPLVTDSPTDQAVYLGTAGGSARIILSTTAVGKNPMELDNYGGVFRIFNGALGVVLTIDTVTGVTTYNAAVNFAGAINVSGVVTAGGAVSAASVTTAGTVAGASVTSAGNPVVQLNPATQQVGAINVSGGVTSAGTVAGAAVTAAGNPVVQLNPATQQAGNINVSGSVTAAGQLAVGGAGAPTFTSLTGGALSGGTLTLLGGSNNQKGVISLTTPAAPGTGLVTNVTLPGFVVAVGAYPAVSLTVNTNSGGYRNFSAGGQSAGSNQFAIYADTPPPANTTLTVTYMVL